MKIAIVSEDGLPDIRVEKLFNTFSKITSKLYFIGEYHGLTGISLTIKPEIYNIPWGRLVNLYIQPHHWITKRKVEKILDKIKPDLVVSINLVAADIVDSLKIPQIIDYHEVYSEMMKYVEPPNTIRKAIHWRRSKIYPKLEEKLLTKHPFITITPKAGKYFEEKYGVKHYITVRNYPSIKEYTPKENITLNCSIKRFYYIGRDILVYDGRLYRDMRSTRKILEELYREINNFEVLVAGIDDHNKPPFNGLGRLKHIELYSYQGRVHYGLITYVPKPIHRFFSPNKAYIYAHIGAVPIITETLEDLVNDLGEHAIIVAGNNYTEELYSKLGEAVSMDCGEIERRQLKLIDYARRRLVWERQEDEIIKFIEKNA